MSIVRILTFAVIASIPAFAEDKKPEEFDAKKLLGKYSFVSGEKYGKALPAEALKNATFEIDKTQLLMPSPEGKFVFAYKIDATAKPMAIDLEITEGPIGKGAKSKGIIKVDGDTVTICYPAMEGERPKEFKSDEKAQTMLFVLKKAK